MVPPRFSGYFPLGGIPAAHRETGSFPMTDDIRFDDCDQLEDEALDRDMGGGRLAGTIIMSVIGG